ncbi:MAG: hypothetical protein DWP92_10490 [Armatimonadetes bacterium]|nr:MAG: hypothetical protein DWP92_10490 [Armatimonadota bacterium]
MRYIYRVLIGVVPPPFDAWIRAHQAELAFIQNRSSRVRWRLGLVPLSVVTFGWLFAHAPRSLIGGTLMRTILATLSIINTTAGVGLAVLYFVDSGPALVAVLSVGLILQGLYTLAVLAGALGTRLEVGRHVQLVGSTLSLVVGTVGVLAGLVTNLSANAVDPEYGPMAVAMLLVFHGLFSLITFGSDGTGVSPRQSTM